MRTRGHLAVILLLGACKPDPGEPYWALDPIALYPEGEGVYGLQTYEIFGEKWARWFAERWYICSVVVEFEGAPTTVCEGCTHAWAVEPAIVETDCPEGTETDPQFLSLTRVGLGGPPPDVEAKDPHPGATTAAWADYGDGWIPYGWAYPRVLDDRGDAGSAWDGVEPFALWPAWAWEM